MDSLTKEAVEELIKDASNIETSSKSGFMIPIISQTRVEGVEVNDEDYEDVPVEEFGKAMLRGMGWKDDDKGVPVYVAKRGFSCFDNKSKTSGKDEEELDLRKGSYCVFISGSKKGRYGKVTDDDGLRMLVEMATSEETVDTCAACLRAVPKKEYEKSKRYINSSKVDKYLEEQAKKYKEEEKDGRHRKDKSRRNEEGENDYDRRRNRDESKRSRNDSKHREDGKERSERKRSPSQDNKRKQDDVKVEKHSPHKIRKSDSPKHPPKNHKATLSNHNSDSRNLTDKPKTRMWLHPDLFVRIIDKNLNGGKYFKEKVCLE